MTLTDHHIVCQGFAQELIQEKKMTLTDHHFLNHGFAHDNSSLPDHHFPHDLLTQHLIHQLNNLIF